MTESHIVVRATGLVKVFKQPGVPAVLAVRGVDLELRTGQLVLVIGPSGSGKTTLLSMLGGLIPPTEGGIELAGQSLDRLPLPALTQLRLRQVGFVFQSFLLIEALSVVENVELPLNFAGIRRPRSAGRASELLQALGLSDRARFRPRALSGGEKQRVAIARAFANDPSIILADEPTGSLDSHAGQRVIELLRAAAHEHGKAVLVVSHDPRVRRYADGIFQMEDGRIRDADLRPA
jgi:putative ABC transport system ATP-binding protein